MGCCFSKETDGDENDISKSQAAFGSKNWFYKCKDQDMRFYILADSVRAKQRSLGHYMDHNYDGEHLQVDANLLTNGDLIIAMIRKGDVHDAEVNLKVALIMVDTNIEVMETAIREDTKDKGEKRARVTFPIVKLCERIPKLTFFVVAVDISVGGKLVGVTRSDEFTTADYNTFYAWRGDRSVWLHDWKKESKVFKCLWCPGKCFLR